MHENCGLRIRDASIPHRRVKPLVLHSFRTALMDIRRAISSYTLNRSILIRGTIHDLFCAVEMGNPGVLGRMGGLVRICRLLAIGIIVLMVARPRMLYVLLYFVRLMR